MNEKCPVCGQTTDMEPGFYYGTSYVSYALADAITVATLVTWWVLIGFHFRTTAFSGGWASMPLFCWRYSPY